VIALATFIVTDHSDLTTVAPPSVLTKVRVDPAGAILRVVKQQTDQNAPVTARHPGLV
jgi:hypothetical protein